MKDFTETHARFWQEILEKDPEQIARNSGCTLSEEGMRLSLAGRQILCRPADKRLEALDGEPLSYLESVVTVTYLAKADGTPPRGEWVSERHLTLGDVYFRGPHVIPFGGLLERYAKDLPGFLAAAPRVGGVPVDYGDAGMEIPALPLVPVRLGLWKADDEFDAEGRMLFDTTADRHLILDGILTLVNIVFKRLIHG